MKHPAACSPHLRDGSARSALALALAVGAMFPVPSVMAQTGQDVVSSGDDPSEASERPIPSDRSRSVGAGLGNGQQGDKAEDLKEKTDLDLEAGPALEAGKVPVPPPPAEPPLQNVPTIISDAEFNASIPRLDPNDDPELSKPLESIEAFERRMAAQRSVTPSEGGKSPADTGSVSTAKVDATQPNTSITASTLIDGEPIVGEAPVLDPELTAPLPPIDQFEVTPVQFAEGEGGDDASRQVHYTVDLQGLELADKDSEARIKAHFKAFSALEKGHGVAANRAMISARMEEDKQLLETVLASEGWHGPSIRTRMARNRDAGVATQAVLTITPGLRYVFSEIHFQADPTEPPHLIEDNFAIKLGEPLVAEKVLAAEAQIAVALPENGYPFAKVGDRDILLDRETGNGIYTLPVTIGPRGRFGDFTTEGDLAFEADHLKVLSRFKHGELYDSRKVDDLRKALVATGLFSTVAVEPKITGQDVGDGTEYVDLHVHQDAGPPRTIAGSIGFAAGEGITAQASWTHRNMFPAEGAVIAHAIAGTRQTGAGATFRRSNAGKRDRTFEVVTEAFYNNYEAYSAYTGRLAARIARDSTPLWQKRYTYAFGVELLGTAETDYVAETGNRKRRTYYVAGLNGQVGFDTTDDLLNPTEGYRVTALVQPEATVRNGFDPYVRGRIDASTYYSVNDSLVLAGRVRFGTIQGAGLFDIAPSRRLYAGGGGSVRGFSYQALGERAPDGNAVGGRSLNEASFEARYRFGNYGVVAFFDAGQAYRETTPQFSNLRYGVGLGGRFYTNFGPMRLDIATPLARKPGESRLNIYVSIGQAF